MICRPGRIVSERVLWWAVFAFLAAVLAPAQSHGEYYRYADENGVIHITNIKEAIPAEYLEKAVPIEVREQPDGFINKPDVESEEATGTVGILENVGVPELAGKADRLAEKGGETVRGWTSDPKAMLAAGGIATAAIVLAFFIFVRRRLIRFVLIAITLAGAYLTLFSIYLRSVMAEGRDLIEALKQALGVMR